MKSVIAAFRDSGTAHQATERLGTEDLDTSSMRVIDERSNGAEIMRILVEHDVPQDRAEQYAEAVRRGAVLAVIDADDDDAPRIAELLDDAGSLDLDAASERWRDAGWTGYRGDSEMLSDEARLAEREQFGLGEGLRGEGLREEGEDLEVVEEQVRVGKREVPRGGVRVRAFVTERPIREALELREERINVTRDAVDEPVGTTDSTFTEEEFVVTATGEEPVVEKKAHVVERVRVDKAVESHTENIEETERRRDVDVQGVQPTPQGGAPRRH